MMQPSAFLSIVLLMSNLAGTSWAGVFQGGYPASCFVYDVCKEDACLRPLSIFKVIVTKEADQYYLEYGTKKHRLQTSYFVSLGEAKKRVAARDIRTAGIIVIPNNEIADAFGLNLYSVRSKAGKHSISDTVTKVACSRISGGLY